MDLCAKQERGIGLLAFLAVLLVLLGILGLVLDSSRMYIAKNELQLFSDSAAIAAAYELDGTAVGISRAREIAKTGPGNGANRWNFSTEPVGSVLVDFSKDGKTDWVAEPRGAKGYKFVRVRAAGTMPIYLMQLIPGVSNAYAIPGGSIAGQAKIKLGRWSDPFSPDAVKADDANFGFEAGQSYKLLNASGDRGYVDLGQGFGEAGIRESIINHEYGAEIVTASVGDKLLFVVPKSDVTETLAERLAQDTDKEAEHYKDYKGNGRRMMHLPVNDPATNAVVGYGTFFLAKTTGEAEYVSASGLIGAAHLPVDTTDPTVVFTVKLFGGDE